MDARVGVGGLSKSLAPGGVGSEMDIQTLNCDVRFAPESGHQAVRLRCPLCANNGHHPSPSEGGLYTYVGAVNPVIRGVESRCRASRSGKCGGRK